MVLELTPGCGSAAHLSPLVAVELLLLDGRNERGMVNPRRKMIIVSIGMLATTVAFWVVCWMNDRVLASAGDQSKAALTLGVQRDLLLANIALILVAAGVGLGWARLKAFSLVVLQWGQFPVKDGTLENAKATLRAPNPAAGKGEQVVLSFILLGAAVLLYLIVEETGGPTNSPFVQFAISGFLWGMLLTPESKRKYVLLARPSSGRS